MSKINDYTLLKSAFREYYFNFSSSIEAPERINEREFGFSIPESGMSRHMSFTNKGEMIARLIKDVPFDVYCSNAFYQNPSAAMQDKLWKGAELIFDIDAKDLDLNCLEKHSFYKCKACSAIFKKKEDRCDKCGSIKFSSISLQCDNCSKTLKNETKKLLEFLLCDFGIKEKNVKVYFSGNAGYHIHVTESTFYDLSSNERTDIIGYLLGNGFMHETIGISKKSNTASMKINKDGYLYGWRKRINQKLKITQYSENMGKIIQKKGGFDDIKYKVDEVIKESAVRIDSQVTSDIHRIFRLGGTINSKSGLVKMLCKDLDSFDPYRDACFIGDREVEVSILDNCKFKLKDQSFKVTKSNNKIPLYAAVYLLSKGLALTI